MKKHSRFQGYMFFFLGTLFLYLAIQSADQTTGWGIYTILFMAFAAFDYFLAFRHFGGVAKQNQENNKK
ncbi:YdiK family protein [Salipaludibacillus sp. HK11]|uniref:YdiK family protein n=1 Tax=Salipaludibacillus sp. HK11 TaxID=3394320 RepID=UPI0039FD92FB